MRKLLLFVLGATLGIAAAVYTLGEIADSAVDREAQNAAPAYERSRRIEAYHDCRKLIGLESLYCTDQAARRAREAQSQEYETAADLKQAIWTKAAGVVAALALFLNLVTILAVFLSWQEQRRANDRAREEFLHSRTEAAQAAIAAERQYRLADTTTRAQLRCYVNSTNETYTFDETGPSVSIIHSIKNFGLTPAHEVVYSSEAILEQKGAGNDAPPRDLGTMEISYGLLGPGGDTNVSGFLPLEEEDVDAINDKTAHVKFSSTITYRDEFGDRWEYIQEMRLERVVPNAGTMPTVSCDTRKLSEAEAQDAEQELPLKGGGEGGEDA